MIAKIESGDSFAPKGELPWEAGKEQKDQPPRPSEGCESLRKVSSAQAYDRSTYTSADGTESSRHVRFQLPSEGSNRESRQFDVDNLINNQVARVLHTNKSTIIHSSDLEFCLQSLGLGFCDSVDAPPGKVSNTHTNNTINTATTTNTANTSSAASVTQGVSEIDLIHDLFGKEHTRRHVRRHLQRHHMSLGNILRQVFWLGDSIGTLHPSESTSTLVRSYSRGFKLLNVIFGKYNNILHPQSIHSYRKSAKKIVSHWTFQIVFLGLTLYTLYSADAVAFLPREYDKSYQLVNTVVFALFMVELVLTVCGHKGFVFSIPFFLDCLSLISLFSDTIIVQGLLSDSQLQLGRLARSSRLTRLVRIVRIARVTRLIPRLLNLCRKTKASIAHGLVIRRLWRIFLFLDTDEDQMITSFDVKWFFLQTLQEFPQLLPLPEKRPGMLQADANILMRGLALRSSQEVVPLSFEDFHRVYLSTNTGKALLGMHIDDLEQEQSIWTLTAKISDSTALKVCLGIILLIGVMTFLDHDVKDNTAARGLAHLKLASDWIHAEGINGRVVEGTYMCNKIDLYIENMQVLFLSMRSFSFIDVLHSHSCVANRTIKNPWDNIQRIFHNGGYRQVEVMLCTPEKCKLYHPSGRTNMDEIALVSIKKEILQDARNSMYTTSVVVLVLLVFVYILNRGVQRFSRTLLQPLRELVDDMQAMSVLELLHIDKDMAGQEGQIQMAEEIEHLTQAFKSMKTAIRSWSKYVPESVVQRLYNAGVEATIGVDKVEATILFCDINGFEENCAGLLPAEVLRLLNNVLARIGEVISSNKGTLLEFIGDEVLAVFNTPRELNNHVFAAVSSAVEIHAAVMALPSMVARNMHAIKVRCRLGIHTTTVFAGNIGSQSRMKYGLLGDGVNLTARLKGLNSRYQTGTLVSEHVSRTEMVSHHFITRPVDVVAVKGKTEPTTVHEVLMDADSINTTMLTAAENHTEAFGLYQMREFQAAREAFLKVHQTLRQCNKNDEPSRLLAARCQSYIEQPPPKDWDGVDRLKQKSFAPNVEETAASEPRKIILQDPVSLCSEEHMVRRSRILGHEDDTAEHGCKIDEWTEELQDPMNKCCLDSFGNSLPVLQFDPSARKDTRPDDPVTFQDASLESGYDWTSVVEVETASCGKDGADRSSNSCIFCPCAKMCERDP